MRTTLNIDDELLKEAKIAAIREGITLTEYIERALAHECPEPDRARDWPLPGSETDDGRWKPLTFPGKPLPGFPWSGSYSEMLEFVEGPDADS